MRIHFISITIKLNERLYGLRPLSMRVKRPQLNIEENTNSKSTWSVYTDGNGGLAVLIHTEI